jgi:hypothetical protein
MATGHPFDLATAALIRITWRDRRRDKTTARASNLFRRAAGYADKILINVFFT